MEKKESKFAGIPFALLFFVVALAVLIDGFTWFFVYQPLRKQVAIDHAQTVQALMPTAVPMVTPTATPSATIAPTVKVFLPAKKVTPPTVK